MWRHRSDTYNILKVLVPTNLMAADSLRQPLATRLRYHILIQDYKLRHHHHLLAIIAALRMNTDSGVLWSQSRYKAMNTPYLSDSWIA